MVKPIDKEEFETALQKVEKKIEDNLINEIAINQLSNLTEANYEKMDSIVLAKSKHF